MNEEVFTLTMPEAEYCLKVCELAALGTSGSDLSDTFRKLHTRLEAELHKTANLDVSLSAEEKNELVKAVMIYEHPIPCNMINCFCMFSDYIPLTLDDWIRLDKGRREEADNKSDA